MMGKGIVRKATIKDIDAVSAIYEKIHTAEEKGEMVVCWQRGIYPEREPALSALERGDLFVMEDEGKIVGSAILNQIQVDVYADAPWKHLANPKKVMVLHTLAIDPDKKGRGYGKTFVQFYESYALENDCPCLRIDTNEKNTVARSMYRHLGYEEIAIIPCTFNGIPGVNLVLLEKYLK